MTPPTVKPVDLEAVEARAKAATEGPWEVGGPYPSLSVVFCVEGGSSSPDSPEPPSYEPICVLHDASPTYSEEAHPEQKADAVRQLREAIKRAEQEKESLHYELRTAEHNLDQAHEGHRKTAAERDALRSRLEVGEKLAEALRMGLSDATRDTKAPHAIWQRMEAFVVGGRAALAAWEDATAKPACRECIQRGGVCREHPCQTCGNQGSTGPTAGCDCNALPEDATESKPGEPPKRHIWNDGPMVRTFCEVCRIRWDDLADINAPCSGVEVPAPPASKPEDGE